MSTLYIEVDGKPTLIDVVIEKELDEQFEKRKMFKYASTYQEKESLRKEIAESCAAVQRFYNLRDNNNTTLPSFNRFQP
jgi:hypothetical protein